MLQHFGRFVRYHLPDFVLVENVPGIQRISKQPGPFDTFTKLLKKLGYNYVTAVIECCDYGVPQRRARLVLLASLNGDIRLPEKTHGPGTPNLSYSVVSDWIKDLPRIKAGKTHPIVPNHRAASLSSLNLKRIKARVPASPADHLEQRQDRFNKNLILVCTRTLLVCAEEECSLVRQGGAKLNDLGFAFAEVHYG